MLSKNIFTYGTDYFKFKPEIDLFASRINKQHPVYSPLNLEKRPDSKKMPSYLKIVAAEHKL